MSIIVAQDIGYGHTKWVTNIQGEIKRGMFPSVAPITTRERSPEVNGMSDLRTVTGCVGDNNYVVGRDAYLEADSNYARPRLGDYSTSDRYQALMLGSLALYGERDIDHLVIGLPLTTLATYHATIQKRYLGEHLIGASYAKRKTTVNVRNVIVSSQPAGAMIQAVSLNPQLRKSTNMVIDTGYFTMDFLMCEGLRPFYARSGAIQGGMSAYYDHLALLVGNKLAEAGMPTHRVVDHFRLEEALCEAEEVNPVYSLRIGSKAVDITDCVIKARSKLNEYLDRMVTILGDSSLGRISTMVLAGGGAHLMLPAVRERLGDMHDYVTLSNSQFAIANGYAQLGVAAAKRAVMPIE